MRQHRDSKEAEKGRCRPGGSMLRKERTEEPGQGRPKDHTSNMQTEFCGTVKTRNSVCRRKNAEALKATKFCVDEKTPKLRKHEIPCVGGKTLKIRKYGILCVGESTKFRVSAEKRRNSKQTEFRVSAEKRQNTEQSELRDLFEDMGNSTRAEDVRKPRHP
jgi:hypothetical protein